MPGAGEEARPTALIFVSDGEVEDETDDRGDTRTASGVLLSGFGFIVIAGGRQEWTHSVPMPNAAASDHFLDVEICNFHRMGIGIEKTIKMLRVEMTVATA